MCGCLSIVKSREREKEFRKGVPVRPRPFAQRFQTRVRAVYQSRINQQSRARCLIARRNCEVFKVHRGSSEREKESCEIIAPTCLYMHARAQKRLCRTGFYARADSETVSFFLLYLLYKIFFFSPATARLYFHLRLLLSMQFFSLLFFLLFSFLMHCATCSAKVCAKKCRNLCA